MNISARSAAEASRKSTGGEVRLRLYVAGSTPNSIRAEQNLTAALNKLEDVARALALEIVDVFKAPKRALTDGVIVTPTLIRIRVAGRSIMIGDLSNTAQLVLFLRPL